MCKSIQKRKGMIDQKGFLILLQEFLGYKVRSHIKILQLKFIQLYADIISYEAIAVRSKCNLINKYIMRLDYYLCSYEL